MAERDKTNTSQRLPYDLDDVDGRARDKWGNVLGIAEYVSFNLRFGLNNRELCKKQFVTIS